MSLSVHRRVSNGCKLDEAGVEFQADHGNFRRVLHQLELGCVPLFAGRPPLQLYDALGTISEGGLDAEGNKLTATPHISLFHEEETRYGEHTPSALAGAGPRISSLSCAEGK